MSLSDYYEATKTPEVLFPQCKTCRWYLKLDTEDQLFFNAKVENPETNLNRLLKACKEGSDVELECVDSSFRNHIAEHHMKVRVQ